MERPSVKYGWVVYLFLGLLWLVVGLTQVFNPGALLDDEAQHITGVSLSELEASCPEATELVRFLFGAVGMLKTSWSLLVLAIVLIPFRRGEKWAWYTLWLAPTILVSQGIFDSIFLGNINEMVNWIPITSISLLGLLIPIRKFFPKNRDRGASK